MSPLLLQQVYIIHTITAKYWLLLLMFLHNFKTKNALYGQNVVVTWPSHPCVVLPQITATKDRRISLYVEALHFSFIKLMSPNLYHHDNTTVHKVMPMKTCGFNGLPRLEWKNLSSRSSHLNSTKQFGMNCNAYCTLFLLSVRNLSLIYNLI